MHDQLYADESKSADPKGKVLCRAKPGKRHCRRSHPEGQDYAAEKPDGDPYRRLQQPPDRKARPNEVEKQNLHPMPAERRPKHQERDYRPMFQSAPKRRQYPADDDSNCNGPDQGCADRLAAQQRRRVRGIICSIFGVRIRHRETLSQEFACRQIRTGQFFRELESIDIS